MTGTLHISSYCSIKILFYGQSEQLHVLTLLTGMITLQLQDCTFSSALGIALHFPVKCTKSHYVRKCGVIKKR